MLATLVPPGSKLDLVYVDENTYAAGLEQAFTSD